MQIELQMKFKRKQGLLLKHSSAHVPLHSMAKLAFAEVNP